jgi:hypothetical protein
VIDFVLMTIPPLGGEIVFGNCQVTPEWGD